MSTKIRLLNGGAAAEVDDDFAKKLLETGLWESIETKRAPAKKAADKKSEDTEDKE